MSRPQQCNPCCPGGVASSSIGSSSSSVSCLTNCIGSIAPAFFSVGSQSLTLTTPDATCADPYCTTLNGTHLLPKTPTSCRWQKTFANNAGCGEFIRLTIGNSAGTFFMTVEYEACGGSPGGGAFATYQKTQGSAFDCLGTHTLNKVSSDDGSSCVCTGWGASITVSPG